MASPDENEPSAKRNRLEESSQSNDNVQQMNELFPKIDNLEYFPVNVLINIFLNCDDMDLINLADSCNRFDGIAKLVFKEKYAEKEFVVDGEGHRFLCTTLFNRFGANVILRAIAIKRIESIDANLWLFAIFQNQCLNLLQITFDGCTFINSRTFLVQFENITHLTIQHIPSDAMRLEFPEFRNLRKIELSRLYQEVYLDDLEEIIRMNPELESLVLRHNNFSRYYELIEVLAECLTNLKELVLIPYVYEKYMFTPLSPVVIEKFVHSMQHAERLGLTIEKEDILTQSIQLLKHLAHQNINHLELNIRDFHNVRAELIDAISHHRTIESLTLDLQNYQNDVVEAMLECLPNVRLLCIKLNEPNSYINQLAFLQKFPSIEQITLALDFYESNVSFIGNMPYFMQLQQTVSDRDGIFRIDFVEHSQLIGLITKEIIVWRNKLMHWDCWVGFYNLSNLTLLDLNTAQPNDNNGPNPFDKILGYLDVESLNSLATAGRQCNQVVHRYVQTRSQRQAPFFITNEFSRHNNVPQLCARYVNNLNVYNIVGVDAIDLTLPDIIKQYYGNVSRLCIMFDRGRDPSMWIIPSVRHFVCTDPLQRYNALHEICNKCPDLETLHCKSEVGRLAFVPARFNNLRLFVFKYSSEENLKLIQAILRHTNAEVVTFRGTPTV